MYRGVCSSWTGVMIPMLLTVREVAELLKVNRNFVYSAIKKGELNSVNIGSIKVRRTDLEEYVKSKEVRQ